MKLWTVGSEDYNLKFKLWNHKTFAASSILTYVLPNPFFHTKCDLFTKKRFAIINKKRNSLFLFGKCTRKPGKDGVLRRINRHCIMFILLAVDLGCRDATCVRFISCLWFWTVWLCYKLYEFIRGIRLCMFCQALGKKKVLSLYECFFLYVCSATHNCQ